MSSTTVLDTKTTVKVIGTSGQISLGKQYAGLHVLIEEPDEGVWLIRTARVIPDNEQWLHKPQFRKRLQGALDWAKTHKPEETGDPIAYLEGLQNVRKRKAGSK